ncbi:MAG TPA: hypothetical protein VGJ97_00810 [Anaerolineaceae bacterium]|jgi:hypothetical protein
MQAIEVTARWGADGEVTPVQFRLEGSPIQVETIGRRWQDERGLHVLVKAQGGQTYELAFSPVALKWFLSFQGASPRYI